MRRLLFSAAVGVVTAFVWWFANRLFRDGPFHPTWVTVAAAVSFGLLFGFFLRDREAQ